MHLGDKGESDRFRTKAKATVKPANISILGSARRDFPGLNHA